MDKIVCLGKNYLEHAKELGDAIPKSPVIFLKPPSVLRSAKQNGENILLKFPAPATSVHHECEIVLKLGAGGSQIAEVSVGLDMTLRDRQNQQKKEGHPWTTSKVFRDSAVVGPWVSVAAFPNFLETEFSFALDGKVRQKGKATQMMLGVGECLAYLSGFFPLLEGDLIYTGTPEGVGPVLPGQTGMLEWGPIRYSVTWG